jgi:hypothetical protein
MDTLTISGLAARFNGEYDCDIAAMLSVSSPDALTLDEARIVKTLSGARGFEVLESFLAGDMDVRMALALVILKRNGKEVDPRMLGDKPMGWARFMLEPDAPEKTEDDADPPTETGTTIPALSSVAGGLTS